MNTRNKKEQKTKSETVCDLFEILTVPGQQSPYENELKPPTTKPNWEQTFESPAFSTPNHSKYEQIETSDIDSNLDDSFERIIDDIAECKRCELWKTRTHTVPGEGNPHAALVLIGEAPGADEDATGRPFVGRAGQHLDKILSAAGFKREELFIGNILKCRPPDNRTPTLLEMQLCTPFLRRQLALIKPKLLGLLGNTSCKYVLGPQVAGITRIRGQWFDSIFGIPCMPMYHPSYLLRNQSRAPQSPNWQMWQDIQALKRRYDELTLDRS